MRIRLNKFVSMCGISSRRRADDLIRKGAVSVNGRCVMELGMRVDTGSDRVEVGGKALSLERKRYLVLNKPKLCLTQLGPDARGRDTVERYISDIEERVFPVGRLDYDTVGLLFFTNDGELAQRIHHPSFRIEKHYRAIVRGRAEERDVERMRKGTLLRDGTATPDSVRIIRYEGENTHIAISFHEGRKHIVKRYLLSFGFRVERLMRTRIGPLTLGKLPRGEWRELSEGELKALRKQAGLKSG